MCIGRLWNGVCFLLKQRSLKNNIVLGCGESAFGVLYVSIALDLEAVYRVWGWDRWTGVTSIVISAFCIRVLGGWVGRRLERRGFGEGG